jgi:hypothetical protein
LENKEDEFSIWGRKILKRKRRNKIFRILRFLMKSMIRSLGVYFKKKDVSK